MIRVGIIGSDTSHVPAFVEAMNGPSSTGDIRITAGLPHFSPDIPASRDRFEGFTAGLRDAGVELVDSIATLLECVDAVLLESIDGRVHLEQAGPVIRARKPVFIDKPVAATLADVATIARMAEAIGVPCWSSSSMRYTPAIDQAVHESKSLPVLGATVTGPCHLEPHHPDLFYYGIHGVEALFTLMGPGCQSVVRVHTPDCDIATGIWKDGRVGVFRGNRQAPTDYAALVVRSDQTHYVRPELNYVPLVRQIETFFRTGVAPVPLADTLEIYAFLEAADESKRRGGASVELEEVLSIARAASCKEHPDSEFFTRSG